MKEYLDFKGLADFFGFLLKKFASLGHKHEISDLPELETILNNKLVAVGDENGNVILKYSDTSKTLKATTDGDGNVILF